MGGAARLSYLPMMDDSSEKELRDVPNRNDERTSHSTRAPRFGISANPDYRRSSSDRPIGFFFSLEPGTSRTPCLFSTEKRIVVASDSWHFSHDLTARRSAAGQLRRRLCKNRRQCPSIPASFGSRDCNRRNTRRNLQKSTLNRYDLFACGKEEK